jgi:hypothetical protein
MTTKRPELVTMGTMRSAICATRGGWTEAEDAAIADAFARMTPAEQEAAIAAIGSEWNPAARSAKAK